MRVAVVHDWLYTLGGAERVLEQIYRCFPGADLYSLFDTLTPEQRARIGVPPARATFAQRLPFIASKHRLYLPLLPIAIEQLDLSSYDLVISSSYAVAKGVITGPDQVHVSYVHSPMRYAWDLQHEYLARSALGRGPLGPLVRYLLHRIRIWDVTTAHRPDLMIVNSEFVARRVRKLYRRETRVIYPPVDLSTAREDVPRGAHFLAASRLVPYKNIGAIVEAFKAHPELSLVVAGTGPELERLRGIAGPNVSFVGHVPDAELRNLMATARAFIFAAEEDFGIITVEALSEGTPVLALGRGGSREIVRTIGPGRTGMFFPTPEPAEIARCIERFVAHEGSFSRAACRAQAAPFSAERFRSEFLSAARHELEAAGRERSREPIRELNPALSLVGRGAPR